MRMNDDIGSGPLAALMATCRLLVILSLIVAMLPLQLVCRIIAPAWAQQLPRLFHRMLVRLLGFRVIRHGQIAPTPPILFVANHISYLDIPVIGSLLATAFIAKSEVAGWPLIGTLARLQNTLFIERRPAKSAAQREQLRHRLAKGQNLVLFAEGTSSDGLHVLPFKSSLFGIAEQAMAQDGTQTDLTIQPLSIACTGLDGLPLVRLWRPFYGWYGDMTLAGHLWNVLKFGRFTVEVTFHPPLRPADFADRKALALYCQQQVARGIERQRAEDRHQGSES